MILVENKYIFTYLIRISIKMTQNKYTYKKKVSRRNPVIWAPKIVYFIWSIIYWILYVICILFFPHRRIIFRG